jgi:hypothetical protein
VTSFDLCGVQRFRLSLAILSASGQSKSHKAICHSFRWEQFRQCHLMHSPIYPPLCVLTARMATALSIVFCDAVHSISTKTMQRCCCSVLLPAYCERHCAYSIFYRGLTYPVNDWLTHLEGRPILLSVTTTVLN